MESYTLAALNIDVIRPTFTKEDYLKWINDFVKERGDKFITDTGKDIY